MKITRDMLFGALENATFSYDLYGTLNCKIEVYKNEQIKKINTVNKNFNRLMRDFGEPDFFKKIDENSEVKIKKIVYLIYSDKKCQAFVLMESSWIDKKNSKRRPISNFYIFEDVVNYSRETKFLKKYIYYPDGSTKEVKKSNVGKIENISYFLTLCDFFKKNKDVGGYTDYNNSFALQLSFYTFNDSFICFKDSLLSGGFYKNTMGLGKSYSEYNSIILKVCGIKDKSGLHIYNYISGYHSFFDENIIHKCEEILLKARTKWSKKRMVEFYRKEYIKRNGCEPDPTFLSGMQVVLNKTLL